MMRYKNIAPKFIYVIGLALNILILIFLAFLNTKAIESGEMIAITLLGFITSFSLLYTVVYVNKCIYLKVDLETSRITYGNIWFTQEATLDSLKALKKIFILGNVYKVNLAEKNFYFIADQSEREYIKEVIKQLHSH